MSRCALPAIQRLLEECAKQGPDCFGFLHYIEKEVYEDAQREFDSLQQATK